MIEKFKEQRLADRGFYPFYETLLNHINSMFMVNRVMEIGVGGGFKITKWAQIFPNAGVVGLDDFDIWMDENSEKFKDYPRDEVDDALKFYRTIYELCNKNAAYWADVWQNITLHRDIDGYCPSAVNIVMKEDDRLFDIIVDDGACESLFNRHVWDVWKDSLQTHGIFVNETPSGNGTPSYMSMTKAEHMEIFNFLAEEYGQVVFGFRQYANLEHEDKNMSHSNYLSIRCHDYRLYMPVIEKFKHCIIAGEQNL
jgi:hypothetical protein